MRSKLSKIKDKLPSDQNSNVVYRVPCSCGKFYIGGTVRRLEARLKEHKEACLRGEKKNLLLLIMPGVIIILYYGRKLQL